MKVSPTRPTWRSAWNLRAVEGDDAGRLLAAMLERMQAERRERRRVLVAEDAEDAAFLVELVVVAGPEPVSRSSAGPFGPHQSLRRRRRCSRSAGRCPPAPRGYSRDLPRAPAPRPAVRRRASRPAATGVTPPDAPLIFSFTHVSKSAGSSAISWSPPETRSGRDCALAIQAGGGFTRQLKNRSATIIRSRPRAAPKTKPSVRSTAPTRLSMTKSEIFIVM